MTLYDERVLTAQNEIGKILGSLESETDSLVESVEIYDIDETKMESVRPEIVRYVRITMRRTPGSRWG